jgi:hypothetical protein
MENYKIQKLGLMIGLITLLIGLVIDTLPIHNSIIKQIPWLPIAGLTILISLATWPDAIYAIQDIFTRRGGIIIITLLVIALGTLLVGGYLGQLILQAYYEFTY